MKNNEKATSLDYLCGYTQDFIPHTAFVNIVSKDNRLEKFEVTDIKGWLGVFIGLYVATIIDWQNYSCVAQAVLYTINNVPAYSV